LLNPVVPRKFALPPKPPPVNAITNPKSLRNLNFQISSIEREKIRPTSILCLLSASNTLPANHATPPEISPNRAILPASRANVAPPRAAPSNLLHGIPKSVRSGLSVWVYADRLRSRIHTTDIPIGYRSPRIYFPIPQPTATSGA